jgi:hypothetical protein
MLFASHWNASSRLVTSVDQANGQRTVQYGHTPMEPADLSNWRMMYDVPRSSRYMERLCRGGRCMLIAHLSDPHLRPPSQLYQGLVASNEMFEQAIQHLNALNPAPDVVLLSGDLTDTGSASEYATAREMLAAIRQPLLAIPGNHDERDAFRACFADRLQLPPSGALHLDRGDLGPVRIIGLDVTVPGKHHGDMDDAACLWLEQHLSDEPGRPTIVMLHHPPFASGIAFIDAYNCRQGDRLATIIARHAVWSASFAATSTASCSFGSAAQCSSPRPAQPPLSRFAYTKMRSPPRLSSRRRSCSTIGAPRLALSPTWSRLVSSGGRFRFSRSAFRNPSASRCGLGCTQNELDRLVRHGSQVGYPKRTFLI